MDASYSLRHFLAALKYRCSKSITNVKENYPYYEVGAGVRTPIEILSHISGDLRAAQSVFNQDIMIHKDLMLWEQEVNQFFVDLEVLDSFISKGFPQRESIYEKLLQGPLSDAMTHVGQLAMIRRMAGDPIPYENFFNADIRIK